MNNAFNQNQWTYCKPSGEWKPSRWLAQDSAGQSGYRITFSSINPGVSSITGKIARTATLTFRAKTVDELAAVILEEFPQAVFSNVEHDEVREKYREAQDKEAFAQGGRDFVKRYDSAWDEEVAKLSPAEKSQAFDEVITEFMSSAEWLARFQREPEFWRYPLEDGKPTNRNYQTLKNYFSAIGVEVPQAKDISDAITRLSSAGCFYKQSYKRSEMAQKNAVKPYSVAVERQVEMSQQLIQETEDLLVRKHGVPLRVTPDAIVSVWDGKISPETAEALFDAIRERHQPAPTKSIKNMSSEELREAVKKHRRPNAPSRQMWW